MAQSDILLEAGTNELEIIEFFIDEGPERGVTNYGVNVAKVLEVIESPGLEPLPGAPHPCFMGAIPLRDIVLPVLDLAVWLGLPRARRPHEIILVTRFNSRTTGFLATGVTNIHRFHWRDVEPPHQAISSLGANAVTGLVRHEGRFILLLDLEKIIFELDAGLPQDDDAPPPSAKRLRALVAEDSGVMRHMIRERLEAANFEIVLAGDGQQALGLLLNPEGVRPDIVISDIEMPRLDGYTLTRRIRETPALARLPVILFSSLITDELRHKGLSVGADEQISKPQFGDLARLAMDLIEKRRTLAD
ncbi:chemotaxis protein [Solidesulfovibrio carbinolicus]|uniref:Chemotaxis protein CheV n=1 Tax=Solidesulfovibrio carbinolicus TaxID=296842 RepID=A0A4P6HFS1_9BACT|nr:chemotaxis protein [Solidesulfovibrio carbinolicus]QAZ65903.1 chemotaxis protein CheV [Solidesulfovibrio carbinolicus]